MAAYNDNELLQRLLDVGTRREAFADLVRLYSEPLYWKIRRGGGGGGAGRGAGGGGGGGCRMKILTTSCKMSL